MKTILTDNIDLASDYLNKNEVIAFPTETVFGLGIVANSLNNFDKLVKIKNRHPDKPFTLMISSLSQVENLIELNDLARSIINKFFPGELTLVLKAKPNIPTYLDLETGFIGIRMPDSNLVLSLINKVNKPLFVPSANPADLAPATTVEEVISYFNNVIGCIIKGETRSNVPSTVIKIDGNQLLLLREGNLKLETIKKEINYENCNWM